MAAPQQGNRAAVELMPGFRYRQWIFALLGFSLLLQTVTLVTPGWDVYSYESEYTQSNTKKGVFYTVECDRISCETINNFQSYIDDMNEAKRIEIKLNAEYRLLDDYLPFMVGVVLSWFLTLVSALIVANRRKREKLVHVWFVLVVIASVSVIIMGNIIYGYLVSIDIERRRIRSGSGYYKNLRIHFPYCVFFFAIACLLEIGAAVLMFKCHYDEINEPKNRENAQFGNDLHLTEYEIQTDNRRRN